MKKLLLSAILIFIGCSHKYTPFLSVKHISELRIGDSELTVINKLGKPILIIQNNDSLFYEYHYRYPNKTSFYLGYNEPINIEKPRLDKYKDVYSSELTYIVRCYLKRDKIDDTYNLYKYTVGDIIVE